MLMENKFGKISRITACAALKNGKTILEDLSFTAPYKIMAPFEKRTAESRSCLSVPPRVLWKGIHRNFLTM